MCWQSQRQRETPTDLLLTLKRVEDAWQEEEEGGEGSKVQEAQAPGGPEQTAEPPDAEEGHLLVPPLVPGADLPVDQEEHDQARGHQDHQRADVGQVVGQQGLWGAPHPTPGGGSRRT